MGRWSGVQGLAVEKRQALAGDLGSAGRASPSSGYRRHPSRSQLVRVERGNPVRVRTPKPVSGKPTVREAQSLGGYRMTEKRMPVAERQRETRSIDGWPLQLVAPG